MDDVGLVLLGEPPVLASHLVKFGPRIRGRQRYLHREYVEILSKAHGLLNGLLSLHRQPEDERTVDHHTHPMAGLGEATHLIGGHTLLDALEDIVVAGLVADEEEAQTAILEEPDGVFI